MKSSIPRDWRRILGRWVARGFVYAAAATARREGHVWTLSQSSKRPDAVIRLYRVILPVSDIERAAQFYGALLDASGSRVSPGRHYFGCGGVILACFDPRADGDPWDASPNPDHVYFSVTDLEGTLRSACDAGAVILRLIETQPWGERSFYCTDPFGNKLCFVAADTLLTAGLLN